MYQYPVRSDELWHYGVKGMHWGVRRYQNYDGTLTAAGRLAYAVHNKAKKKEPQITRDITSVVKNTNASMHGLEHRLKTKESIERKINTDSLEKKLSLYDAASDIKDGVRYTTVSKENDFVKNYSSIKKQLLNKGYTEVRCKNYFDLYNKGQVKHKSVQSVFADKDGYKFEMQFQTPASQLAKDKKVPIYEEARNPKTSKLRKQELEQMMVDLAEQVPEPKDIYKIRSH